MQRRSVKEVVLRLVGMVWGILLALVLIEVLLRLFNWGSPSWVQPDEVLGWSNVPNAHYSFIAPEGCPGWSSAGRINSHGLHDYEYGYQKPPGTFRILALGDSFTEGLEHPLEYTWTKLLETRLNNRDDGLHYEVINAGRSGIGTGQEYLYFTHEGYRYSPDLVILLVYNNDLADNSTTLAPALNEAGPLFTVVKDQLVLDVSFRSSRAFRLKTLIQPIKVRSLLVSFLTKVYNQSTNANNNPANQPDPAHAGSVEVANALEVTRLLLIEMGNEVDNKGARLVMFNVGVDSIAGPGQLDRLLTEVSQSRGIPYFDLSNDMIKEQQPTGQYMFGCSENGGEGHWSRAGHLRASNLMYEFLLNRSLLP